MRASDVQLRMKRQVADLLTAGDEQVAVYVFGLHADGDPELRMVDQDGTVFAVGSSSPGGGGSGCCCELLIESGTSAPPVPLTNEAEDDFVYSDCEA